MAEGSAALQRRLDAVFGGLATGREQPGTWQPRTDLVTRLEEDASAAMDREEEEQAGREYQRQRHALEGREGVGVVVFKAYAVSAWQGIDCSVGEYLEFSGAESRSCNVAEKHRLGGVAGRE